MTLSSWRDGAARRAITEFLGASQEIAPEDRIAVFDNDGTLWCEKPTYTQVYFFAWTLERAVAEHPELGDRPEYRAVLEHDREAMARLGLERVALALVELYAGSTPEQFDDAVRTFFATTRHPERDVPFGKMVYQPMLELLGAVREHGFTVYLVTGGGTEFVRAISRELYGVSPAQVVGSEVAYDSRLDGDMPILIRTGEILGDPNEGLAKVANLQRQIGRRPMLAVGNSPGDAEMLAYATGFDGPSLAMIVDHDDAEREYRYESVAGTFASEETILDKADRLGWTTISMREDWDCVFPS